jgi:Zn-dependent protease
MTPSQSPAENADDRPKDMRGPFGGKAFYLGRIFGIAIGVDYSWIIIFSLVTFSLSAQFASSHENWPTSLNWATAIATSILFFVCLLLHELGHSITSNRLGLPIHSITLFIFGGVARLTREPDRPRDEFLIAAMGPAVSIALGGFFLLVAALMPDSTTGLQALGALASWLGTINLVLVVFNCIPGFPLDGGRVLRSIMWGLTGNFEKSTKIAASGGAIFAHLLIIFGVVRIFLAKDFVGGLWMAFIGWFLLSAARSSVTQLYVKGSLESLRVGEVFDNNWFRVPGSMSVAELIEGPILRQGLRTFFPESEGQLLGLVTLHEVKEVPREERETTPLQAIVHPIDRLHALDRQDTLWSALQKMDSEGVNQLPVVENGQILGILTRETVLRILRTKLELGTT